MYQIYDCIADRHDPYLLLLAVVICPSAASLR